jgi:hypothetical protein
MLWPMTPDLVSLRRSAAMLTPGQTIPVERDTLIRILDELDQSQRLLERFGTDLTTIARRARP